MRIENGILYDVENKDLNEEGSFVIPDGVTSIGNYAFSYCHGLTNITIPDGVTRVGRSTFFCCGDLRNITIPDSVTAIGAWAFEYCYGLKNIVIGNSVKHIGENAFYDCHGLVSKKSIYKAFKITKNGKLKCKDKIYTPDKWHTVKGDLKLCKNGIHYCTNLFEIFNYYSGELDTDIAIYECEVKGEDLSSETCSKHCCKWLKPVKKLSREEIINILNGKEK